MAITVVGEGADLWCTTELCNNMNINCEMDSINIAGKAIECGAPVDLAEQFTTWGILAMNLNIPPKVAIQITRCTEVLVLYLLDNSKEARNSELASQFIDPTQIKALKIAIEQDIQPSIALHINSTEKLHQFNKTVLDINFGMLQRQVLNTNKIANLEDVFKFSLLEQVEILKMPYITIEQALDVKYAMQLEALKLKIPYKHAIQFKNNFQLKAYEMGVSPEFAIQLNSTQQIEYLKQFSYAGLPISTFFALHLKEKGVRVLQNITDSYNSNQESQTNEPHPLSCVCTQPITSEISNHTIMFELLTQTEAFLFGVSNVSLIIKFLRWSQVNALKAGINPEDALNFVHHFQVQAVEYGVPYPDALKFRSIHIQALETGKIANATDALKFYRMTQVKALEINNINITQALAVLSPITLEVLMLNVSYEVAVNFTNNYQLKALKMGVDSSLALEYNAQYQIQLLSSNASHTEVANTYWVKTQFFKFKRNIDFVINSIPYAVIGIAVFYGVKSHSKKL